MQYISEDDCVNICNSIKCLGEQEFIKSVNGLIEKTNIYEHRVFYDTLFYSNKGIYGINITDDLFKSCINKDMRFLCIYENANHCDLVTSYERFVMIVNIFSTYLGGVKHLVSFYLESKIEKHKDYYINSMKEIPEIWSNVFMNMFCINKMICKLACKYLPYEKTMANIVQTKGMPVYYTNLELFLRTTNKMIECRKYKIDVSLNEGKYNIFNQRDGKAITRDIGYMLNNKYIKINFHTVSYRPKQIEWDSKMYDMMKLLIRKQKVIKRAKNFSNVSTSEKMWKLNFMRSFEYHNNLHKLKLSCKS